MIQIFLLATSVSVAAPRTEAGAGMQFGTGNPYDDRKVYEGFYRTGNGALMLEGGVGYAPNLGRGSLSGLTHTLVDIANVDYSDDSGGGFILPVDLETWSVYALADWSIVERVYTNPWMGGPRLLLGGGVFGGTAYYASFDDSLVEPPYTSLEPADEGFMRPFVMAGVSLDVWKYGKWGLRLTNVDRIHIAPAPQYDPDEPVSEKNLVQQWQTSIDFLVRLK
jgi:hypothetical protein